MSDKVVLHGICKVAEFFRGRKASKQSGNSVQSAESIVLIQLHCEIKTKVDYTSG
jgi:hypothetical protein